MNKGTWLGTLTFTYSLYAKHLPIKTEYNIQKQNFFYKHLSGLQIYPDLYTLLSFEISSIIGNFSGYNIVQCIMLI